MSEGKCVTQRLMEGFGLEFPKDADKFVEIFTRKGDEGGTFGHLIDELIEAFPDKKEVILSIPVHTTTDGEVHVELPSKDD